MSLRARLLTGWLRQTEKRLMAHTQRPDQLRRRMERTARLFFRPPRDVRFGGVTLGDGPHLNGIEVVPQNHRTGPLILYLHGGGYVFGSPRTHRAMMAHLAVRTRLRAILPCYRLAPEHPFPAALDDALTAYRAVMDHPAGVILGGDSAGGGLSLSLLAQIKVWGLRPPIGTFCFSPLTDFTFSGDSFVSNASADAVLPANRATDMAKTYLCGAAPDDPRASPLFADFTGAGPVWLTVGDTEILLDDTRRMTERLVAQGVDVTCVTERDLPHVWPLMQGMIPEARQTLTELSGWITALSRL
ncbi:alpha/beta hydrolase [Rhodobacteraceae bacterium KMM 6894]|nr:alpha/beta hydrolase [Rhodobacteraceae bacterium KMM 6894]